MPSAQLGLTAGSYEAYCLDQAVWYCGITISSELDKVGQKKQRGQAANEAARKRLLDKFMGGTGQGAYADPFAST